MEDDECAPLLAAGPMELERRKFLAPASVTREEEEEEEEEGEEIAFILRRFVCLNKAFFSKDTA